MKWLVALSTQPSLKMIAERAGFAVTTISKALHDAPNISEKTKRHIRKIADELGYVPDRAGVSLRTGKTNKIVLLMQLEQELSDFSRRLILGLARVLERTPYELVLHPLLPDGNELDEIKKIVKNRSADGLVLAQTSMNDPRVKFAQENNFPIVTHGRTKLEAAHAYYDFDNELFAQQAAMRLADQGCRSIGLFAPEHDLTYFQHLKDGLGQAAKATGCETSDYYKNVPAGADVAGWLRDKTIAGVKSKEMPQGVICSGELAAVAIMDGIVCAGKEVGRDVKIISRKTSSLLEYLHPRIEWVDEDLIAAGEHLAQFLLKRIGGEDPTKLQIVGSPAFSWLD